MLISTDPKRFNIKVHSYESIDELTQRIDALTSQSNDMFTKIQQFKTNDSRAAKEMVKMFENHSDMINQNIILLRAKRDNIGK